MWQVMKNFSIRVGITLLGLLIVVGVLRLAGVVDAFWLWVGILGILTLPAVVSYFLYSSGFLSRWVAVSLPIVAIGVLLFASYPIFLNHFAQTWPFTSEAAAIRAVDTDVRTADAIRPTGTGLRVVAARHRQLREEEITRWAEKALADVRSKLGKNECLIDVDPNPFIAQGRQLEVPCTEKWAEAEEQRILREKEINLKALQQVKLELSEGSPSPGGFGGTIKNTWAWLVNHLPNPNSWSEAVMATMLLGVILLGLTLVTSGRKKSGH